MRLCWLLTLSLLCCASEVHGSDGSQIPPTRSGSPIYGVSHPRSMGYSWDPVRKMTRTFQSPSST